MKASQASPPLLTVGEVAKLAHVSVRALHHYDELGLLTPSARSEAGYRLYSTGDLERLQHILFYKELGFGLEEIGGLTADPVFDRREVLAAQRDLVTERVARLEAMLALIDRTLISMDGGVRMTDEEMFEVFGDFDPAKYEDEVGERWGDTDAYKESARRTRRYTKKDWKRIQDEGTANLAAMAALFDQGVEPSDSRAMDVAEEARLAIDRNFYACSREMHVGLGEMYVADPRFAAYYDSQREGLARWFYAAIRANASRTVG
jgi:DNA-binding transcriptional MerR regulator